MVKKNYFVILVAFAVFCFEGYAKDKDTNGIPPVSQSSSSQTKLKGYPGKHPNFEEIGSRKIGEGGVNFYSIEKEIALGKTLAADIERSAKMVDDPIIAEYVNRIGQNLVRSSDSVVPFTFKVLDAEEVNAFALPGGFLFVNAGLILSVKDEAELAGVMAHEIAHIAARHGTKQVSKGQIASLASIPLILMGGWTGYGIYQAANFAIPLSFLKFSRDYEEEADELGLQYLWKAGYDPSAMPNFFETLAAMVKRKQGKIAKIFSSHPPSSSRMKRTQNIIKFLTSKGEYVLSTSEFIDVKDRLAGLNKDFRKKDEKRDKEKPTLRRKDNSQIELPEGEETEEDDEPPELKRRD